MIEVHLEFECKKIVNILQTLNDTFTSSSAHKTLFLENTKLWFQQKLYPAEPIEEAGSAGECVC